MYNVAQGIVTIVNLLRNAFIFVQLIAYLTVYLYSCLNYLLSMWHHIMFSLLTNCLTSLLLLYFL